MKSGSKYWFWRLRNDKDCPRTDAGPSTDSSLILIFSIVFGGTIVLSQTGLRADETARLEMVVQAIDRAAEPQVKASLIRGMLSGLSGRRNVTAPKNWSAVSEKLYQSEHSDLLSLSSRLSQIFGDKKAQQLAIHLAKDRSEEVESRTRALQSLITQKADGLESLLKQLVDDEDMTLAAVRGFSAIASDDAPRMLLERFSRWNPALRKASIETLASRKPYARVLLRAIEDETVSRQEIPSHVARSLDLILGDEFRTVFGEVPELETDRQASMKRYKDLITPDALKNANASRGRLVFEKTCANCHVLYSEGGKIGPDLTGSNRANLDYILLNSIDPSYDVPDGYKMVIIQTSDGRVINGVIAAEDNQRLVLKTVEQPELVILKEDIEARKVSPKSMMPDGQLDQLKPKQVLDLIKYLQTTEQVEKPQ